ncbi:hypothetical protein KUA55_17730 [Enterococcus sp. ALS3]|uniref:Uncharacterized protein n=1 Tax=Enterococcus alishanensis TaxID=1303817 RepID=A0ABS6THN8_9ENTE|nr:hypothetical protein [Enterococcus alishanensis]MBV7392494.1 hypothetical protein [Enterococcus alishanensis]
MKKKNKGFLGAAVPILVALFAWGSNYLNTNQEQSNQSNTATTTEISHSTMNQDAVNLDYDGSTKVVTINNNQPNFNQEELSLRYCHCRIYLQII